MTRRRHPALAIMLALACLGPGAAAAAPAGVYRPDDPGLVVATLPQPSDPAVQDLRRLAAAQRLAPGDLDLAATLGWRYLDLRRRTGDPRFGGYAEGVIGPWLGQADPPAAARVLRAAIRQGNHDFAAALADLDHVLAAVPDAAQARLIRATIRLVQGDVAGAGADCRDLPRGTGILVAAACRAAVDARGPNAAQAYRVLSALAAAQPQAPPAILAWCQAVLGEIAQAQGDAAAAERHFRAGLDLDPDDLHLRGALADLLLDAARPAEVRALVERYRAVDGMLLRLALAGRQRGDDDTAALVAELAARFADAARRGDGRRHWREEAIFHLRLTGQPALALAAAEANWATQREPIDARLLREAALAKGNTTP